MGWPTLGFRKYKCWRGQWSCCSEPPRRWVVQIGPCSSSEKLRWKCYPHSDHKYPLECWLGEMKTKWWIIITYRKRSQRMQTQVGRDWPLKMTFPKFLCSQLLVRIGRWEVLEGRWMDRKKGEAKEIVSRDLGRIPRGSFFYHWWINDLQGPILDNEEAGEGKSLQPKTLRLSMWKTEGY